MRYRIAKLGRINYGVFIANDRYCYGASFTKRGARRMAKKEINRRMKKDKPLNFIEEGTHCE